jgi:holo-[acyl-carrier protein] synthase
VRRIAYEQREPAPANVGIDVLETDRLARALKRRPGLVDRLFTAGEREYANRRADPLQHLAARFCAKEATVKALSLAECRWHEIEVVGTGGPPSVRLSGSAAARAGELGVSVKISLTHVRTLAGAVAIAVRET